MVCFEASPTGPLSFLSFVPPAPYSLGNETHKITKFDILKLFLKYLHHLLAHEIPKTHYCYSNRQRSWLLCLLSPVHGRSSRYVGIYWHQHFQNTLSTHRSGLCHHVLHGALQTPLHSQPGKDTQVKGNSSLSGKCLWFIHYTLSQSDLPKMQTWSCYLDT